MLADQLTEVFCEKLGIEDMDSPHITASLTAYKELFSSLSGGATILEPKQIKALESALKYTCDDASPLLAGITGKIRTRLEGMKKPVIKKELIELDL